VTPSPFILFAGGLALLNLAAMALRYPALGVFRYFVAAVVAALGVASIGLGLGRYLRKPKPTPKRTGPRGR
jgi:hypothetical protein